MKEMKRILAIFLCLVMLVGVLPAGAMATEDVQNTGLLTSADTSDVMNRTGDGTEAAGDNASATPDEGAATPGEGAATPDEGTATPDEGTATPDDDTAASDDGTAMPEAGEDESNLLMTAGLEDGIDAQAEGGTIYILAGSDFQASSHDAGATIVSGLLDKIKVDYPTMNGFLFAGDYDVNYSDSANGKAKLQETVQAVYGTAMDEIYVQGNHDSDNLVGSTLTASGANDAENYGVFVINEKDYMWYNDDEATIKKTAENLEAYLNAKRNAGYTKPIFVMSHLPLHYCMRTRSGGNDGMHANYIFDVLNEAGNAGLNIIFMFGHNHSHGWDDYLGGAAIFLTHGDKINIAQNSTTVFQEETLAFTYMNAGYVGYYGTSYTSDVDKTLTMTTFAITDEDVTISRYDSNGTHDLKSAGVYNVEYPDSAYYSTDDTVVGTPYILTLNTEITPAGEEVEAPETGSGSNVDTSGGNWVTITEPTAAGYKYELDTNGVDTGVEYLIVANSYAKALSAAASSNNAVDIKLSDDKTIAYATSDTYGWTFTRYGNGVYYICLNDSTYLRLNNGSLASSTRTGSDRRWTVTNNNDGSYDIVRSNYNLRWSNSNGVFQVSSSNEGPVRLYKYVGTTTAQAGLYGKLEGELVYNVPNGTSAEDALAAVKAGITVKYATAADYSDEQTLTDKDAEGMTWTLDPSYNGAVGGEYAVTIAYNGVTLGTAKVVVPAVNITGYEVTPMEGNVRQGSALSAGVGSAITVTLENGTYYTVPVTVSMLSKDGQAVSTKDAATLTGLTVTYNGVVVAENYTLNVLAKVVNDYPTYPNEGAVKVGKTATGIDFQTTGVARVELSASGVPTRKGADVVVVIDTSSSMRDNDVGNTGKSRIEVLSESLEQMLQQFQAVGEDGQAPDISIAIIDFNGYFPSSARTVDKISFTDSYRDNADYAKVFTGTNAGSYIKNVGLSAGNFVAATSLNAENIAGQFTNDNCMSGTNYDGALENAYNLLAAKKAANGEEERDQYVIFLSDGAPFRYNGFNNGSTKSTYAPWNNWLTGAWASVDAFKAAYSSNSDAQTYGEFHNGNGTNHPHRYAEAIKGAEGQPYSVVQYVDDNTAQLTEVVGLGATIYSIGFGLADDGDVTVATQQELITVISSGSGYYYPNVQEADDLVSAFTKIVTDIRYAAYNARFADTMGEHYNIQLKPTVTRASDGAVITLAETPKIEVRSYTIWTRAEYQAGQCTLDQIGDRKTSNGSYIYDVLETVTFNADGTEAYSTLDSVGPEGATIAAGSNIFHDGVIYAASFWYNTKVKTNEDPGTVAIDTNKDGTNDYDLPAESFYWSIGNIITHELALSYYVHLDGSMSGKPAGSYPTNESAVLYYDNYLGNPCHKDTTSPVLAWEAANVSYAFYLVNSNGEPVNMNGEVVPFANRVPIVNPTLYDEVELNVAEGETIEPLEIVADNNILPSGYTLYDYGAVYHVTINSDATGSWTITNTKAPDTTYVTGHSDTEQYTKKTATTAEDGYDYTHTTVWFAVVWEPRALPDTVVIDYGLPVDVHVLTNDMFGSFGELIGVANGVITDTDSNNNTNEVPGDTADGIYGVATVRVPETGANESNSVIRYTLNGMEMKAADVFTYSVRYTNTALTSNNGYYYGTLTVIPATTIYYEDDFVDLKVFSNPVTVENEDGSTTTTYTETKGWMLAPDSVDSGDVTQDEDRPDDVNYAFDTVIDANNVYGYDSAYKTMSKYSLGSAAMVNVTEGKYATATFDFYGTGFDIISLTDNTTGTIVIKVYSYNEDGTYDSSNPYVMETVDTYYGYSRVENDDGTISWVTTENDPNALYQVPVMKIGDGQTTEELPYGKYRAEITVSYVPFLDHTTEAGYNFYLDAIRIYNPTGNQSGTANDAYEADGESFPAYYEVRDKIIDLETFNSLEGDTTINGAVFIDGAADSGAGTAASVADYTNYGPNNELYLEPGDAISFTMNAVATAGEVAKIQLAVKSVGGTGKVEVYGVSGDTKTACLTETISTATDMYYDITALNDQTVVIKNAGADADAIISITNVKVTYTAEQPEPEVGETVQVFSLRRSAVDAAVASLNETEEETVPETTVPEETEPEETVPETTVPEETEPEETVPETTVPEETEPEETKPSTQERVEKAVETIRKAVKKLFGWLFG